MVDEKKVANEKVKETPAVEPTQPEPTKKDTTEVGAVAKETPIEPSDRLDKHPRFQEVNTRMKEAETKIKEYQLRESEKKFQETQKPPATTEDPYAGMTAEEVTQTNTFMDKFVGPYVDKKYGKTIQQIVTDKQIEEAQKFVEPYGINVIEKLPEIVPYISRPENRGRLSLKEAMVNLYFDEMQGKVKNQTTESYEKQKEELIEKKKQANMQSSTVTPSAVIQGDEAARAKMNRQERLMADIRKAQELAKQGVKNPKVRGD